MLSSDEAKSLGVEGWDAVLADIEGFKAKIAEHKIANFWASWRHNLLMARKAKKSKGTVPNTSSDPTAEASGPNTSSGTDTPNVDVSKRKCTDTPGLSEPHKKRTYAGTVAEGESGEASNISKPKKTACNLWVHSNLVQKGDLSESYFLEVISRCNLIKVDGVLEGKSKFSWWPDMRGQPSYESDHARSKIVCYDQITFYFWCK